MRTRTPMLLAVVLLVGVTAGVAADPTPDTSSLPAPTPETVLASLNASIEWYRQARVTMREVNRSVGALFAQEDQETARQALQRAFAVARARAALLKQPPDATSRPQAQQRLAGARAGLEASIKTEEQRASRGPERERAAARRRLALDRARLQVMTQLQGFNASMAGGAQADLSQQIDALEQSAPELRGSAAAAELAATLVPAAGGPGGWTLVSRLIGLHRSRAGVDDLTAATVSLSRSVSSDLRATAEELRRSALGAGGKRRHGLGARRRARIPDGPRARQSPDGDADPAARPRAAPAGRRHRHRARRRRDLALPGVALHRRRVVFPNSVVFTGTFFKHPAGEEAEPLRRSA